MAESKKGGVPTAAETDRSDELARRKAREETAKSDKNLLVAPPQVGGK